MLAHAAPIRAVVIGLGAPLPSEIMTNTDIETQFGITPQWIESRTGISSRHRAGDRLTTAGLATHAARQALATANVSVPDMLILATSTPDDPLPATGPQVAHRLGLGHIPAFDISAVCSGFVFGIAQASAVIEAGHADTVLVVAAERFSSHIGATDGIHQSIFGDGSGAIVLRRGTEEEPGAILATELGSDGQEARRIWVPGSGSGHADPGSFTMDGAHVFREAVRRMTEASSHVVRRAGWTVAQVDWVVPHQANRRIIEQVLLGLGLGRDSGVTHLNVVGNTAAASIPLALAQYGSAFAPLSRVVLPAFGGGYTWGAAAMTWPESIDIQPILLVDTD